MKKEKFKNPKLQKLYEILNIIFPERVSWQDIGENEELICLTVDIKDFCNCEAKTTETLYINTQKAEILAEHLEYLDVNEYMAFVFEKNK